MKITLPKPNLNLLEVLSVVVQVVSMAVFGYVQNGLSGAVAATIIGSIVFFVLALIGSGLKRLDRYETRKKIPQLLKDFLRKNPETRVWIAELVGIPLFVVLWVNIIVGWIAEMYWLALLTLFIIFALNILMFVLSAKHPEKGSKVVLFDEVNRLLESRQLDNSLKHFEKALNFYYQLHEPDYPNSIKEAVCALEDCVERLTDKPASKKFSAAINEMKREEQIPVTIAEGINKLHAYRGAASGVSHAAPEGSRVTEVEAELVLDLVSSYIVYFCNLFPHKENEEVEKVE